MKMVEYNAKCYLWKDPSLKMLPAVQAIIKENLDRNDLLVTLCCMSTIPSEETSEEIPTIQAYLLHLCRSLGLIANPQTTYLGARDHFLALRLVVDAVYRKEGKGEMVSTSDVTYCHRQYVKSACGASIKNAPAEVQAAVLEYKEFVERSNSVDDWILESLLKPGKERFCEIISQKDFLILGVPTGSQELALLKLLSDSRILRSVSVETPLDASFRDEEENSKDDKITLDDCEWNRLGFKDSPAARPGNASATQRYAEETISAILRLVVNIRDELALVKALMCPLVSLPQKAFTLLKKSASQKGLSLCQTAISYVTKVRLGGRSYAPPIDCSLRDYLSQLEIFVDLLHKLQTILEEETKPHVAVQKLVSTLRVRFRKCAQDLREEAVQAAADRMTKLASVQAASMFPQKFCPESEEPAVPLLHWLLPVQAFSPPAKSNGVAGTATVSLLQRLLDRSSSWQQDPIPASGTPGTRNQHTPIAGPSPLSFFRTPDQVMESIPALSQRIAKKGDTPVCTRKFNAGLPWGDDGTEDKISEKLPVISPSKSVNGSEIQVQVLHQKTLKSALKVQPNASVKRAILGDISNQSLPAAKKPRKSKKCKEPVKGQQNISSFFQKKPLTHTL